MECILGMLYGIIQHRFETGDFAYIEIRDEVFLPIFISYIIYAKIYI